MTVGKKKINDFMKFITMVLLKKVAKIYSNRHFFCFMVKRKTYKGFSQTKVDLMNDNVHFTFTYLNQ